MIERIAEQLGLKRQGRTFAGPCPICGGTDRFTLSKGKKYDVLYHCRHGCQFSHIIKELEDRGIVEKDEYNKPSTYISRHDKEQLVKDRFYTAMYEQEAKQNKDMSLSDWRKYKQASERKKNLEARMGLSKPSRAFA
jgi:hypothetical protein